MAGLVDAHCHLQDERIEEQLKAIIERAHGAGVYKFVCCGTQEKDWPAVLRIKGQYPDIIIPSFGLHPWYIKKRSVGWLKKMEDFLSEIPSGVGEIGLDYAADNFRECLKNFW